ncbi:unnamed protein product [Protopolystoma xenopodis]|uniref:Uncharacterized protein n=1 Tax=Protopolystoma xenopodis TaxID=117903 RepID=A0A448XCS2_9PLAT|nr:unnamed protein product [Protopolystoma xenopodis]
MPEISRPQVKASKCQQFRKIVSPNQLSDAPSLEVKPNGLFAEPHKQDDSNINNNNGIANATITTYPNEDDNHSESIEPSEQTISVAKPFAISQVSI